MTDRIPSKALSIMQPWAWLIVSGHKDIENRDWRTRYRGPVAIHAGKKLDLDVAVDVYGGFHPVTGAGGGPACAVSDLQCGGIVGVADIVDCVEQSDSEWFVGRFGFVIRDARPIAFIPARGALGFFDWRASLSGRNGE